jgi:hypothetical protein
MTARPPTTLFTKRIVTMTPIIYPLEIAELLALPCRMPLGPGIPDRSVADKLQRITLPSADDPVAARACLAGLWLRFNHLDESHRISQELEAPEGSAWHAVMHRREPDAWNSKYWWRRVGGHPVLEQLRARSPEIGYRYTSAEEFVDFCERVRGTGSADEELAEAVQELEWRLLFEHCYRKAAG